jgi:hypothetical protein
MNALRRSRSAAQRLASELIDDFTTTAILLILRISLPLLKRVVGVRRLASWLSASSVEAPVGELRTERITRAREMLAHGGRLLIGTNCLDRSLAGFWLLRRAGASPTLVLGAKRQQGALAGHAWIELEGGPLEPRSDEFLRIASFGGN